MATAKVKTAKGKVKEAPAHPEMSADDLSKDKFYVQLGELAEAMIATHGKEFAMGTLLLSARFIAEGKSLTGRTGG